MDRLIGIILIVILAGILVSLTLIYQKLGGTTSQNPTTSITQLSSITTTIPQSTTVAAASTTRTTTTAVTTSIPRSELWTLQGFVIGPKVGNEQDLIVAMPDIVRYTNGTYRMYYSWANPTPNSAPATAIKSAVSSDGVHWIVESGYRIKGNVSQSQSEYVVAGPSMVRLANGTYRMYYDAEAQNKPGSPPQYEIYSALSKDGINFIAEGLRIAISSQTGVSLAGHGKFFLLQNYTTVGIFSGNFNSSQGPSSLVLTTSKDGLAFGNFRVLYNNWHDPTIFQVNGTYKMYATYLASAKGYATSTDGVTWPAAMTNVAFQAVNGTVLTEGNSGVGDIGGGILPNGMWVMYTDWQNPSQNLAYFTKQ